MQSLSIDTGGTKFIIGEQHSDISDNTTYSTNKFHWRSIGRRHRHFGVDFLLESISQLKYRGGIIGTNHSFSLDGVKISI